MKHVAKVGSIFGVEYLYWGTATDIEEAEKFFIKPTSLKRCMELSR